MGILDFPEVFLDSRVWVLDNLDGVVEGSLLVLGVEYLEVGVLDLGLGWIEEVLLQDFFITGHVQIFIQIMSYFMSNE